MKQQLRELSKKHQAEALNSSGVMAVVEQEIVFLAKQLGYSFTLEEWKAYDDKLHLTRTNGEVSDSELEAVSGGWGKDEWCFVAQTLFRNVS